MVMVDMTIRDFSHEMQVTDLWREAMGENGMLGVFSDGERTE